MTTGRHEVMIKPSQDLSQEGVHPAGNILISKTGVQSLVQLNHFTSCTERDKNCLSSQAEYPHII